MTQALLRIRARLGKGLAFCIAAKLQRVAHGCAA